MYFCKAYNYQEFNLNPSPNPSKYQKQILIYAWGKPRDTFVWHYPKHEFYYAFNKLVMQLHVVCMPEIQTDVLAKREKIAWENYVCRVQFQQQFSCSCLLNAIFCRLSPGKASPKALKTETVVLSSTAFCNT